MKVVDLPKTSPLFPSSERLTAVKCPLTAVKFVSSKYKLRHTEILTTSTDIKPYLNEEKKSSIERKLFYTSKVKIEVKNTQFYEQNIIQIPIHRYLMLIKLILTYFLSEWRK